MGITTIDVLSQEEWDALLGDDYPAFPACCVMVEQLRSLFQYLRINGPNYMVAVRCNKLVEDIMDKHYLEWSEPFMKLSSYMKEWKYDVDAEDDAWEWGYGI